MTREALFQIGALVVGVLISLAPAEVRAGDPLRGEALYVGTASFGNGGAPCLGCHGIAGAGLGRAAGANYGPDLTPLYQDYGEEDLASILEDLAFPSMEPIYADRPLTQGEQADLAAFFAQVTDARPAGIGAGLALDVTVATAVFLGLIAALGWRRLKGVRKPLVERALKGRGERS